MTIVKGFVAGFIATVALSALMLLKSAMGLMPDLNVIAMLAKMTGGGLAMGWLAHFVIGTIAWGGLFAYFNDAIPGNTQWLKGVVFGTFAWLAMMIFVMPVAGAGFFALNLGVTAMIATLVLHWAFGAVLGLVYEAEMPHHLDGGKHA